jgi:hypothetical protein
LYPEYIKNHNFKTKQYNNPINTLLKDLKRGLYFSETEKGMYMSGQKTNEKVFNLIGCQGNAN